VVPEIDTEPRPFGSVHLEAPLTWAASRDAPAERPHVGGVSYLLLFALIAAAIHDRSAAGIPPGHAPGGCAGRCVPGQSARCIKPASITITANIGASTGCLCVATVLAE
jgi:hypothetical protein